MDPLHPAHPYCGSSPQPGHVLWPGINRWPPVAWDAAQPAELQRLGHIFLFIAFIILICECSYVCLFISLFSSLLQKYQSLKKKVTYQENQNKEKYKGETENGHFIYDYGLCMYVCMGVCMCVCDMSLWYVFCCDLILNKILTMDLYSSQQIEHLILSINDNCAR